MKSWVFILFFFTVLVGGCSHLDSRCPEVNWYEVGRQDSTMGYSLKRSLAERRKVCALSPDSVFTKAYINGFNAGLREYCNFKTGYTYGLSQIERRNNSCPDFLGKSFLRGYTAGQRMAEIQKLQKQMQEKISDLEDLVRTREYILSQKAAPSPSE